MGKPTTRPVNNTSEFAETVRPSSEPRLQFLPANRGRARRLDKPCPNQGFYVGKSSNDDELRDVTGQIATMDLRASRNAANRRKNSNYVKIIVSQSELIVESRRLKSHLRQC